MPVEAPPEKAERLTRGATRPDGQEENNEMILREGLMYGNMLVSTLEAEACEHERPRDHRQET
jgi:hypothetical protein